ncbi:MAG: ABC transporter permease [Vallitaleaceae bacterium]|jgi:ABC-2 type transport system permease protein|nr:ABC transporter permease [Vallitaleaceae bacterium]
MLNLIIKDFKNIFYDIKSLAFILIMPIALMSILGMALQGVFSDTMSSDVFSVQIGVVKDYDYADEVAKVEDTVVNTWNAGEYFSDEIINDFNPETSFFNDFLEDSVGEMVSYTVMTNEEADAALKADEIQAYVVLPKNFVFNSYVNFMAVEDVRYLSEIKIVSSSNPSNDFASGMVNEMITPYFATINNFVSINRVVNQATLDYSIPAGAFDGLREEMMSNTEQRYEVPKENIPGSKTISSFQYYAVGIMAMFILYSASIGARAMYDETKEHTFQRLEVAGAKFSKMSVSNFFRVMLIVMVQSGIMITYSSVMLKVDWGSIQNLLIVLLLSSFAVAGVGTFIATLTVNFNNPRIGSVFEFAVVQMMALLGGSFIPVEVLPEGFQKLSFLSLNASVLGGYLNGMYDRPLIEMLEYTNYMIIFGLAFIVLSLVAMKFRRRESLS